MVSRNLQLRTLITPRTVTILPALSPLRGAAWGPTPLPQLCLQPLTPLSPTQPVVSQTPKTSSFSGLSMNLCPVGLVAPAGPGVLSTSLRTQWLTPAQEWTPGWLHPTDQPAKEPMGGGGLRHCALFKPSQQPSLAICVVYHPLPGTPGAPSWLSVGLGPLSPSGHPAGCPLCGMDVEHRVEVTVTDAAAQEARKGHHTAAVGQVVLVPRSSLAQPCPPEELCVSLHPGVLF